MKKSVACGFLVLSRWRSALAGLRFRRSQSILSPNQGA